MSIIAAIFNKDSFLIATDTLISLSDKDTPCFPPTFCGHTSKICHYPHLRCCVVIVGCHNVAVNHGSFVKSAFCSDITDLVDQTADDFVPTINFDYYIEHQRKEIGNMVAMIFIMGYSKKLGKMVAATVDIRTHGLEAVKFMNLDLKEGDAIPTLMSPRLQPDVEEQIVASTLAAGGGAHDALIAIVKQMHLDSLRQDTFQLGVGGEIHLTEIGIHNGRFFCAYTVPEEFPNCKSELRKIAVRNQAEADLKQCMEDAKAEIPHGSDEEVKALYLEKAESLRSKATSFYKAVDSFSI